MRILHIIKSMDPSFGGPCQGIRNSNPVIISLGGYREVVSLDDPEADFLGKDDFRIHALGPEKGPWFYSDKFLPWIESNISDFDVVIMSGLWLYQSYAIAKVIRKLKKRGVYCPKFFVMPHGMLDPYFQKAKSRKLKAIRNWVYWKLVESKVVNEADGLLFTCQVELELARIPFRPYHPNKEINVGYGIQPPPKRNEEVISSFLDKINALDKKGYFLFLSRINEKKGVDILIKAYSKFVKDYKNNTNVIPDLVIAGPGLDSDFGKKIVQLAQSQDNLPNKIIFAGMLTGDLKWSAFYGCEAFILPSHQENFGIAVAEALSCAKPVLISNQVNIWKEILIEGGGIVKEDNEEGTYSLFSEWIELTNEEKQIMGQKASLAYQKHFAIEPAAKNLYLAIS